MTAQATYNPVATGGKIVDTGGITYANFATTNTDSDLCVWAQGINLTVTNNLGYDVNVIIIMSFMQTAP